MVLLKLVCKGCGYTWYPDKELWEKYPDADEPDCPNEDCPYYGTSSHPSQNSIWLNEGM